MGDYMKKSFIKVFLWRLISITITMIVMSMLVGSVKIGTWITLVLHSTLLLSHLVFELAWVRIESRTYERDRNESW